MVSTSWDDGHPLDFKIASLLSKHKLPGVFYIPRANGQTEVMSEQRIQELSATFEIGGHTLNHVVLDTRDKNILQREVHGSFEWLKAVTGTPPTRFCFPKGVYNTTSLKAVFDAGYQTARTTELLSTACGTQGLEPTSLQMYEHSLATYARHLIKRGKWLRLVDHLILHSTSDLLKLTEQMLDKIETRGGCFHLWGHSWEIEEFGLWDKLEEVMKMVSGMYSNGYQSTNTKTVRAQ